MQQTKLKVLDLFSGIGGFSLGLESLGQFETIAFCEKDKFCQKVLHKNFPNITIEGEIRDVGRRKIQSRCRLRRIPMSTLLSGRKKKRNR